MTSHRDRFPLGFAASLILLLAGMALSVALFGLFAPYWRVADQDLILAYQGLLYNDGLPQEYFDHTGYVSYLLLGNWYRLLHAVGLLDVHAVFAMPHGSDPMAVAAWEALVRAGRILSLITAGAFTVIVAVLVRRIAGDSRIAMIAAIAFAFSGSVAMNARIMRTELLAGGFVAVAFLLLVAAARDARTGWRPLFVGAATFCAVLALANKVQALAPLLVVPALVLVIAWASPVQNRVWSGAAWAKPAALLLGVAAIAVAVPAAHLLASVRDLQGEAPFRYHEVGLGLAGRYQFLLAGSCVAAAAALALWRKVPATEAAAALAAIAIGASLGVLALAIRFSPENLIALTHPIEHQFVFATWTDRKLAQESQVLSGALLRKLGSGLTDVLRMHVFLWGRSLRPTLVLEWVAVIGAVAAWRRGERRLPAAIASIIAAVILVETVFAVRALQIEYFIFTEPFILVAAVLVMIRFRELLDRPQAGKWLAGGLIVLIAWGHIEPARRMWNRTPPLLYGTGDGLCVWETRYLTRIDHLPPCAQ